MNWLELTRPDPTWPSPDVTLSYSSYLKNEIRQTRKKYQKMHTSENCDVTNFHRYLPNVANMNSIRTGKILGIFPITRFLCTVYLKTNKIRNLKQATKNLTKF